MAKREKRGKIRPGILLSILISFLAVNLLVYFTKSINIYWCLYAIPLIIAAFAYGVPGSVVFGIIEAGTIAWWTQYCSSYLKARPSFSDDKAEIALGVVFLFSMGISLGYLAENRKSEQASSEGVSNRDALTGLPDHSFCISKITEEKKRSDRFGTCFSVVMIDIDSFKVFNDTFGREAGDEALKEIAKVLTESGREVDIVCRYGGEEFAILLPQVDTDGARVLAERIRAAIESTDFCFEGGNGVSPKKLTVSAGIAGYPYDAGGESELLVNADSALCLAKMTGPNKTCTYSELGYEQWFAARSEPDKTKVSGKETKKVRK